MLRMTQWAEIRRRHQVDGAPKEELTGRFNRSERTVQRALQQATTPERQSVKRPNRTDRCRDRIENLLRLDPDLAIESPGGRRHSQLPAENHVQKVQKVQTSGGATGLLRLGAASRQL